MMTLPKTLAALAILSGAALALPAFAQPGSRDQGPSLDADGDGVVTQEEFIAAKAVRTERRFERLDSNSDGQITPDDLSDLPQPPDVDRDALRACVEESLGIELPAPPVDGSRFDNADLNGDGAVTLDEALTGSETAAIERFERLDTNVDGLLQTDELRKAKRRAGKLRQTRRQCRDEQEDIAAILGA